MKVKLFSRQLIEAGLAILIGIFGAIYALSIPSRGFLVPPFIAMILSLALITKKRAVESLFLFTIFIVIIYPSTLLWPNLKFPLKYILSTDFVLAIFLIYLGILYKRNLHLIFTNRIFVFCSLFYLYIVANYFRGISLEIFFKYLYLITVAMAFFIIMNQYVEDKQTIEKVINVIFICAVLNAILAILQFTQMDIFFIRTHEEGESFIFIKGIGCFHRLEGFYSYSKPFGTFLSMSVPLLIGYYRYSRYNRIYKKTLKDRLCLGTIFILILASPFSTRSSFIAISLASIIMYVTFFKRIGFFLKRIIMIIGIFALFLWFSNRIQPEFWGIKALYSYSAFSKISLWVSAFELFKTNPWFGIGFSNGVLVSNQFASEAVVMTRDILGISVSYNFEPMPFHNFFFTYLAELGITGVIIFGMIISLAFKNLYETYKFLDKKSPKDKFLILGIIGGIIGGLVDALFHNSIYTYLLWILIGIAAKVKKAYLIS